MTTMPSGFLPGGLHRAHLDAGRVAALLARHGQVEGVRFGNLRRLVVGGGFGELDAPFLLHSQNPDPVDLGIAALVVFVNAPIDAAPAADATGDIEPVAEFHAVHRRRIGNRHLPAVALAVVAFEVGEDLRLAFGTQLDESLSEHPFHEA